MVYLAEVLVVMADRLKIVTIHARNVHRTRTQALRRRRVSRVSLSLSLSPGKQRCRVLRCGGAVLLKHKKSFPDNLRMSASGLWARKLSRQYALFTLTL